MSRDTDLLTEIRDLLQVLAEPLLAKRDQKMRAALREVVGSGARKRGAIALMDGSRTQSAIVKESGIDHGNLSRLVKALAAKGLIGADEKHPKLLVHVPTTFFDGTDEDE